MSAEMEFALLTLKAPKGKEISRMTALSPALPSVRWLSCALVGCLALAGLTIAVTPAEAAQKRSLGTITLCIKQKAPNKGSIRFVQPKLKCLKGERRVMIVTTASQQGVLGIQGSSEPGPQGEVGPVGPQGDKGDTGSQGIQGDKGDKGDTGSQGIQGVKGDKGDTGSQGIQGVKGDKGDKGDTGSQGIQGVKGDKGDKGDTGSQGIQGVKGDKGDTGSQGIQGVKGDTGDQGPPGIQGPAGQDGRTILSGDGPPSDEEDGENGDFYIDTTNDDLYGPKTAGAWGSGTSLVGPQGEQGLQGTQGIQGLQGIQGPPGDDGTNGTDGRTILNGDGPPSDGEDGENGDFYIDTETSTLYGPKTAGAWGSGTSLVGPQGEKGEKGDQGPPGPAGGEGIFAVVNVDGTLARGSSGVSSTRPSNGNYLVTFPAAVTGCAYTATQASVTAQASAADTRVGLIEPVPVTGQPAQVRVFLYDKGGSPGVNRSFHLVVTC